MSLALGNLMLLLMVIIELLIIKFYKKEIIPWKDVVFNLNSGHIVMWVLRGVELSVFYYFSTTYSIHLFDDWSFVALWIFTFISWDFCFYWLHRLHHKISVFWMVHVVHHEGKEYNLSLGIRNSWYSSLSSIPFFIGLAIIGVPFELFLAISSMHYFVQFYNHNGIVNKSGFLEKIMVTPSHHRVHHGVNPDYIDKNFGGTLVLWDKLFGTFQEEKNDDPVIYGTLDHVETTNLFWANNIPVLKFLRISLPKFKKENGEFKVEGFTLGIGAFLLFTLLLNYILYEDIWSNNLKFFLFTITFLGTLALGGQSEGKKWGIYLWFVVGVILPVFFIYYQNNYWLLNFCFALLFIHSIYTSIVLLRDKSK